MKYLVYYPAPEKPKFFKKSIRKACKELGVDAKNILVISSQTAIFKIKESQSVPENDVSQAMYDVDMFLTYRKEKTDIDFDASNDGTKFVVNENYSLIEFPAL